jgi:hypothetical protein
MKKFTKIILGFALFLTAGIRLTNAQCAQFPGNVILSSSSIGQTSATINVTLPTGMTTYSVTKNGAAYLASQTAASFTDNTLAASTTYSYVVTTSAVSTGTGTNSGTCIKSNTQSVTTLAAPNPCLSYTGTPAITAGTPSQTSVTVTVTLPPGTPSASYTVFRNGASFNPSSKTNTQFVDNTLTPGALHTYYIIANNGAGCNSPNSNTVNVNASSYPVPTLHATAQTPVKIQLNWNDVQGEESYQIWRSVGVGSSNYTAYATAGQNQTQYPVTDLIPGVTYNFIIRAGFAGNWSNFSAIATATTPPLPPPTNLSANTFNCSAINLSWNDAASSNDFGEEGYEIYRAEGLSSAGATLIASIGQNSTTYHDNALKSSTNYTYFVVAKYAVGRSLGSNLSSTKTNPFEISLAGPALSSTATINWTACSPSIVAYKVFLSDNGAPATEVAQVGQGVTTYKFNNLKQNNNYTAYVVPLFNTNWGGGSNVVSFKTTKYPIPTDFKVETVNNSTMKITWSDIAGSEVEESYILYRDKQDGSPATAIPLGQSVVEHIDNNLDANTKYCYYVVARYGNGLSDPTAAICEYTCPISIASIDKTEASSSSAINIFWTSPAGNTAANSNILLESSTDGQNFTLLNNLPGNIGSFTHTGLQPNQKVYYRLKVVNQGSCSSNYSAVITGRACPAAPTNIVATPVSSSKLDVMWDASTDIVKYNILRSSDNIDFEKVGEVTGDKNTFSDTGLQSSKKYYYKVQAVNDVNCISAASEVKQPSTATTCPGPPTNVIATSVSAKEIKLTFTDNAPDETGFEVQWSKDGTTFAKVGEILAANTTSVNITTGVDPETKYFFRIRSLGSVCNSDMSLVSNVTTNPPAPTGLTANGTKINQADLAWSNTSKTTTGVEIQRATGSDNNFVKVQDAAANATSFQNTGLTAGTLYKYRVRNTSPSGFSEWSNVADANTLVITAIEDESLDKAIVLYPVPTQKTLYVKSSANVLGKINAKIVNAQGKQYITQEFNGLTDGKTEQINVQALPGGYYFLELYTKKGRTVKKFLKQ